MRTCRSLGQLVPLLLLYAPGALSECLENRVELHFDRSVAMQNGRNLSRDAEQLVDGHLRDPNRVLNREHHVFGNLDKLTDERQVLGRRGHRRRATGSETGHREFTVHVRQIQIRDGEGLQEAHSLFGDLALERPDERIVLIEDRSLDARQRFDACEFLHEPMQVTLELHSTVPRLPREDPVTRATFIFQICHGLVPFCVQC